LKNFIYIYTKQFTNQNNKTMGFVSFVKKLFGAQEEVTETPQVVEPTATVEVVAQTPVVESQITDSVTTSNPTADVVVNTESAVVDTSTSVTETVSIKEDAATNKKVVIRKKTYKPKANVTKKSTSKSGLSNNG
jgi:hypothetical protein